MNFIFETFMIIFIVLIYLILGNTILIISRGEFDNVYSYINNGWRIALNIITVLFWPVFIILMILKFIIEMIVFLWIDIKNL